MLPVRRALNFARTKIDGSRQKGRRAGQKNEFGFNLKPYLQQIALTYLVWKRAPSQRSLVQKSGSE